MYADGQRPLSYSRRHFLAASLPLGPLTRPRFGSMVDEAREVIATVDRDVELPPPVTLGIARVVLRPDASSSAAIPGGVRLIVVESGLLAVAISPRSSTVISSAELAMDTPPDPDSEVIIPAGTAMAFEAPGVASIRNPGTRSVVVLDAVVFHEEPRAVARAFTTDAGLSFQLLASASAGEAPTGRISVTLERLRVSADEALPPDLRTGVTLMYIEAGGLDLGSDLGTVFSARAAASAPYALPGALNPISAGDRRAASAGAVIFVPHDARALAVNRDKRVAEVLSLALREAA